MRTPPRDFRARALDVLGLADPFTEEDLKKAYRGAARKHHPDYIRGSDEAMQQVNEARDYLREHPTPDEPLYYSFTGAREEAFTGFSEFVEFLRQQEQQKAREKAARARTPGGRAHKWEPRVHNREDPEKKAREERAEKHADFLRSIGLK